MQPLSYTENTTTAMPQAIFTDDELAGMDDVDRAIAETVLVDTGAKQFALTVARNISRVRADEHNEHVARDACQFIINSALDAGLTRRTPVGKQALLAQLISTFSSVQVADAWDRAEDARRQRFMADADPALGPQFVAELWDQRGHVATNCDPQGRAKTAIDRLLTIANRGKLDQSATETAIRQALSQWCDVEVVLREHAEASERQDRERSFCRALAGVSGKNYDSAFRDLQRMHAHIETLRTAPGDDRAIDGIAGWIDAKVPVTHKVAAVDFLTRKIGEFADPDNSAYRDIRRALAAEREDALTQRVAQSAGAAVADALAVNHCNLSDYLSISQDLPSVLWGDDKEILWAKGEALLICSDIGCGKTTLAGLLARAILDGGDVLGYPVQALRGKPRVLYLALDRPAQIGRSLARQITSEAAERYGDQFAFVTGPLPLDLSETPDVFPQLADYYSADIVIVDSLKDIAMGISEDRAMAQYNRARQSLLASGRELVELHHLTKKGDLYGAKWLDAGVGSVLRITGKPGGAESTVSQYKPVAHLVPPIKVTHDRDAGEMLVNAEAPVPATAVGLDVAAWVAQHPEGVTKVELVAELGGDAGNHADRERAARQLNALAGADGPLRRVDGAGRANPTRWVVEPARESSRTPPDVGV
jgi:energy-coupling factor transporter ATP-binding protein EcfA2